MKFYLTTAIPYVNANPHIGHALEYIQADVIHRYHQIIGDEVFFASGADENALKNVQAAEKAGVEPKKFLETYSKIFQDFYKTLGAELNEFRRGTDQKLHWPGVQELWRRCDTAGDIYKKSYKGLYCVGCEQFYLPKDLINGKCPNHLKEPDIVEEENYFFKLSKYQKDLERLIKTDELNIIPDHRKNEVLAFVERGLEDFSISRSNERARGIGVPVPDDPTQKMYVWFDALTIYLTAVGFGYDEKLRNTWWPADLHVIGKDIIRFHCVYWPAMLLSAKLPLPKAVFSHGFITSGGQKMSKTLGNVIDPMGLIEKFGVDALRYFLLREISPFDDGDITIKRFKEVYNADLANGLGNLVQRVATLCDGLSFSFLTSPASHIPPKTYSLQKDVHSFIEQFRFNEALRLIWDQLHQLDQYLNSEHPWDQEKKKKEEILRRILLGTDGIPSPIQVSLALEPFLPETSEKIKKIFSGPVVTAPRPLFPRV